VGNADVAGGVQEFIGSRFKVHRFKGSRVQGSGFMGSGSVHGSPRLIAALLFAFQTATASAQPQSPLESLTLSGDKLPKGCRLAPVPTSATGEKQVMAYPSLRENPWVGTDLARAVSIRRVVEGPWKEEDKTRATMLATGAPEVVGAYRAVYLAADGSKVDVYGVRFSDAKWTMPAAMAHLIEGQPRRLVRGATALLVLASRQEDDCYKSIVRHLESTLGEP
jgi:hypothetical protein